MHLLWQKMISGWTTPSILHSLHAACITAMQSSMLYILLNLHLLQVGWCSILHGKQLAATRWWSFHSLTSSFWFFFFFYKMLLKKGLDKVWEALVYTLFAYQRRACLCHLFFYCCSELQCYPMSIYVCLHSQTKRQGEDRLWHWELITTWMHCQKYGSCLRDSGVCRYSTISLHLNAGSCILFSTHDKSIIGIHGCIRVLAHLLILIKHAQKPW